MSRLAVVAFVTTEGRLRGQAGVKHITLDLEKMDEWGFNSVAPLHDWNELNLLTPDCVPAMLCTKPFTDLKAASWEENRLG